MEDIKNFASAIAQIAEEKGIPYDKVIEIIEQAYAAAYKKDYGERGQIIKAKMDPKTGFVEFWQQKLVVDENMIYSEEELEQMKEEKEVRQPEGLEVEGEGKVRFNPEKHIMLEEAKKIEKGAKAGDELKLPLKMKEDYGRIAAQTAKQVIIQKIREAEREMVLSEYKNKEGQIISGIVQRVEPRAVFFDIGKTIGILPREEQVMGEFYRPGQRLKLYVLKAEESPKGPVVFLSRAYPKFISKLFELEVPEVSSGSVVIKAIAREAGSRAKIAVASETEGVDPIGSMVGQRGTRVSSVINELGGEKIDIIEWDDDPEKFIANSLSPAKVLEVKMLIKNKALVVVPDDQLSLAIGKDGQNVRLAAKLTGWKIDVRAPGAEGEAVEETSEESAAAAEAVLKEEVKKEAEEKPAKEKKVKKAKKKTEEK